MAFYGSLGDIDVGAISKVTTDTATDVFVYDTRKDSDGGAWRKRTQHTSWYNETLNTATRGSRREFPAVAVIVAETSKVTIYDGDDPDMPMWMVFQINAYNTGGNLAGIPYGIGYNNNGGGLDAHNVSSVYMINGQLFIGGSTGVHAGWSANFLSEIMYEYLLYPSDAGNTSRWTLAGNISQRNDGAASTTSPSSRYSNGGNSFGVKSLVNDVAMTVLPNAPIDPSTGLPVPTIAVATNSGISIIKDDGTVSNKTTTGGIPNKYIDFLSDGKIVVEQGNQYITVLKDYVSQTSSYTSDFSNSEQYTELNPGWQELRISATGNGTAGAYKLKSFSTNFASAHPSGLVIVNRNDFSPSNGMHCSISRTFNTGWMHGDIKGAWLSDTSTASVTGTELITNGTFATDTSGWTSGNGATISVDSQRLKIQNSPSQINGHAYQAISTVVGQQYVISFTVEDSSSSSAWIRIGTSVNGVNVLSINNNSQGNYGYTFTATSSITYVTFMVTVGIVSRYTIIDNVSVRLAELDRSVNNKGLQVFGTLTKTPVATGSNLVGYSGFSDGDYLLQPYNSNMDFSGNFYVTFWAKTTDFSDNQYIIFRSSHLSNTTPKLEVFLGSSTFGMFIHNGSSGSSVTVATSNWPSNVWTCFTMVRSGSTGIVYINGTSAGTGTLPTGAIGSSSSGVLQVGRRTTNSEYHFRGSLSLLRMGSELPSPEQIKKIYDDEKVLFQENSQCTLYGSSDAVTALAYDDTTELLSVGTSSGRSDFQGLRRINNTTTAVTTAISASNGLIVEQ